MLKFKRICGAMGIVAVAVMCSLGSPAGAQEPPEKIIEKDVTIQAGKWAVARMRNMSDNTELAMAVQTNGQILFLVLDEQQMKKFPKISDPLVMTKVDGTLALKTDVRKGGNYYLLFWNKYSDLPVPIKFQARVRRMVAL